MKKISLLLLLLIACGSAYAQQLKTARFNGPEYAKGHIIVKFKNNLSDGSRVNVQKERLQLTGKYKATVKKQWRMGAELWQIDTLQMKNATESIIDSLKKLPYIQYAEPDFIVKADVIPNDPFFNFFLWGLNNTGQNGGTPGADISALEAWDITTGDTNIVVGVIDTGIDYLHPDLAQNIWTNWDEIPGNGIDDDYNGYIDDVHGWDFINNDNDPMDDHGHGTHVAGTIGAVANNGIGVTGVAWNVRMMALKFIGSDNSGPISAAISAVEYATANGAKLTNNSWGGGGYSQALYDAISDADLAGVLFIAAAGNAASDNDIYPFYPSSYDLENIISVASTDRNDVLSTFSNFGLTTVDIAAPGTDIYSTKPNNSYQNLSGTSMATPHVSGAAVLAWSEFPGSTNRQIKDQLLSSCDTLNNLLETVGSGGRLNTYFAVADTNFLAIVVSPRQFNFGVVHTGNQSVPISIRIENVLDKSILIDSVVCESEFYIKRSGSYSSFIPSFSIGANQSDSLQAIFQPASTGFFTKYCRIYYTSGSKVKNIDVMLRGVGVTGGTIVPGGSVSGVWDADHSPYYINGDIEITGTNSLRIDPGVEINFYGHYSFTVYEDAELFAVGNQTDSIFFTSPDTITGWNGLRILNSRDTDSIAFCNFSYAKKPLSGGATFMDSFGGAIYIEETGLILNSTFIRNSTFKSNTAYYGAAIYYQGFSSSRPVKRIIGSCKFLNNVGAYSIVSSSENPGEFFLVECEFNSNNANFFGHAILSFLNWQTNGNIFVYKSKFINSLYPTSIIVRQSSIIVANCLFNSNNPSLYWYSQIRTYEDENSKLFVTNNTYVNNSNSFLYSFEGNNKIIQNSIFWENSTNHLFTFNQRAERAAIEYCDIPEGYTGFGNINSDPFFLDYNNFHLQSSSSCMDAGAAGDIMRDTDGSRNDMGIHGGNGVIIKEREVDFGIAGTSTISDKAIYDLQIINFRGSSVIFDSIHFTNSHFFVEDTISFPLSLNPYSTINIRLAFSPDSGGLFRDSLLFFSNDLPLQISKLPVFGTGISGTTKCGILSDTLKLAYSPYYITCSSVVPDDSTLVIEPGVKIKISPDKNLDIYGIIKANGTKNDSVIFTCAIDSLYWGNLNLESKSGMQMGSGILSKYTIFERARRIKITNNTPFQKKFENSAFRYFDNPYYTFNTSIINLFSDNVNFENCVFYNNSSSYYLLYASGMGPYIFSNCLFYNNKGINYLSSASFAFKNSTFIANDMSFELVYNVKLDLLNSIIYNNPDIQINNYPYDGANNRINIKYCDIKNGINGIQLTNPGDSLIWGDGNISLDPKLNYSSHGYLLESRSPCINAGIPDTTGLNLPSMDVYSNIRIWNDTIDIGANEYGCSMIVSQPSDIFACSGNSAVFVCKATGDSISYQWLKNNTPIAQANNDTLILNNLQFADSGHYTCIVSNPCRYDTSNLAFLSVNSVSDLLVHVSIVESANPVSTGTLVTFTATPTNGGIAPSYQWKVNGTNVGSNNPVYSYLPANNDMICCVLTSSGCFTGNPATSNSVNMVVDSHSCGSPITVIHTVSGGVAPVAKTVTYGTVLFIPGEPAKCWITSNLGADHQAMAVDDASEASAGWYWQFNRKQGYKHDGTTRTPNSAWITPISENTDWQIANDPCALELGCGWRIPAYSEWNNVDAIGNWTNWTGPWNSGLKLHSAGLLWNGSLYYRGGRGQYWSSRQGNADYGILLHFDRGSSYWGWNFKEFGFSMRCLTEASGTSTTPTVTTTAVSNVGTTSATSGGNVLSEGGASVTARGVCWSISQNPTIGDNHTTDGSGPGTFTSIISGLTTSTTYYVRAYATNCYGMVYGSEQMVTTLLNPVLPEVTTNAITNISQASATSGGSITFDGGSEVTARGVCWSISQNPTISDIHTTDGSGLGTFTSSISGLTTSTTYYVRAYATICYGTVYGSEQMFTTLLNPVLPVVTTTENISIGLTSTTGVSNVTFDGGDNITARGVCWSLTASPTIADTKTADGSGTGTFTSIISGLTTNTTYYLRAYATNSVGTAYGNEISFKTLYSCGSLTIDHVAGAIAPVGKTVTYGTVANIAGETTKCWITSNLGADHQATAVDDDTEPSAGWYWQFNRKQGYKHDGTTRTPNSAWITPISENTDWEPANDPCALELGCGWRIPTYSEWNNVKTSGNWANWTGPWNSGLKLHSAGLLGDGSLYSRGGEGLYWSSTQGNADDGHHLHFFSGWSGMSINNKVYGMPLRCLRDSIITPTTTTVTGTLNGTLCYDATQTIMVAGNGTTFTVQIGGNATMIAGQNIKYLPTTIVQPGGSMWGYIALGGPFCQSPSIPAVFAGEEKIPLSSSQSSFKIYPNPTTGTFILELTGDISVEKVTVDIYGIWGEKILTETINGERKHEFSLSDKPSGVYFIRIISGNKAETVKIIKQ